MKLIIDPPSGTPDSYFDVRFRVSLDQRAKKITATVFNKTYGQQLDLIGVHSGYIVDENIAIFENTKSIEGFVSLFIGDRKNTQFRGPYIDIDVKLVIETDRVQETTLSAVFYNESSSLDAGIVPVDINLLNKEVQLHQNEPLRFNIMADREKTIELVIRSEQDRESTFLVAAKSGLVYIEIPAAILAHDLQVGGFPVKCSLFYIQKEGITYSRFLGRRYMPVADSGIVLKGPLLLESQQSIDPLGQPLSHDFVLSDRYFVPTPKEFSAFRVYDDYDIDKISKLSLYLHEAQDMESIQRIFAFQAKKQESKMEEVAKTIAHETLLRTMQSKHTIDPQRIEMFNAYRDSFNPNTQTPLTPVSASSPSPVKKGCGCGRKNAQ
jgi:hypothetical protein